MQHSQPHIMFYQAVILLTWGGNMLRKVGSLTMILSSESLAYFSTLSSGGINMLVCSSIHDTCNNNFVTNCVSA